MMISSFTRTLFLYIVVVVVALAETPRFSDSDCPTGFKQSYYSDIQTESDLLDTVTRNPSPTVNPDVSTSQGTFGGEAVIGLLQPDSEVTRVGFELGQVPDQTEFYYNVDILFESTWDGHTGSNPERVRFYDGSPGSLDERFHTSVANLNREMCYPNPMQNDNQCDGSSMQSDTQVDDFWYPNPLVESVTGSHHVARWRGHLPEGLDSGVNSFSFQVSCEECETVEEALGIYQIGLCFNASRFVGVGGETENDDDDDPPTIAGFAFEPWHLALAAVAASSLVAGGLVIARRRSANSVASAQAARKPTLPASTTNKPSEGRKSGDKRGRSSNARKGRSSSAARKHRASGAGAGGGGGDGQQPAPPSDPAPTAVPKGPRPQTADLGIPQDLLTTVPAEKPRKTSNARRGSHGRKRGKSSGNK